MPVANFYKRIKRISTAYRSYRACKVAQKKRRKAAKACLYMNDHILKDIHGMDRRELRHLIAQKFL